MLLLQKPIRTLMACWLRIFYRIDVAGKENIPPSGRLIILGNQKDIVSVIALQASLKNTVYWAVSPALHHRSIFTNIFLKLWGCFSLNPQIPDSKAFRKAFVVLEESKALAFYPGEVNAGIALFSMRAGCKALAVSISREKTPRSSIKIVFGKTHDFHQYRYIPVNAALVEGMVQTLNYSINELSQ